MQVMVLIVVVQRFWGLKAVGVLMVFSVFWWFWVDFNVFCFDSVSESGF